MTLFLVLVIILGSVISIIKDEDPNEMHFSFEPQSEVECSNVIVAQSEFGLGCFAKRDFKEGEIIERGVMMPLPGVDGNEYDHLFTWSNDKKLFASGSGCLPFYNHSDDPNIAKVGDLQSNRMKIVALRDIVKGEELRNRYMSRPWRTCFKNLQD